MEIFTTYNELDPNSKISVSTRRLTFTGIERNVLAYVYRDKGVDFFSGDFTHYVTFNVSANSVNEVISPWVLSNDIDGLFDLFNPANNHDAFKILIENPFGVFKIALFEADSGGNGWPSSSYTLTLGTTYYLKIVRDESVGTYGTLYLYIYDDAGRTNLLATLGITLHVSKKDFRYIFPLLGYEAGPGGHAATGYIENLELIQILLSVTTQPVTSITATTATGNGTIVNTGTATVTAHGHCWATTIDPTLSDSSIDNGEGSLGAYTTSMQNLVAGQQYYVRAFITSTEGTVFGANVVFTAGYTSTQLIAGNLAIVQGRLQYIDASGVEKYIQGTPA